MRLGSIEFINSLPVDLGLLSGAVHSPVEIVQGAPSFLNEALLSGQIDVSPVSTIFYAGHADDFLLLPDLSISSYSGVESVLLFSRVPMAQLGGKKIGVTSKARTTPALLQILCQTRFGCVPQLVSASVGSSGIPPGVDAMLLIGDEALIAKEKLSGQGMLIIDLAQEWTRWTGLPFVFAVWVARKEAAQSQAAQVDRVHEALLESRQWGFAHLDQVLSTARGKTGLPDALLQNYFSSLSYDFGQELQNAMKVFFNEALKIGLLQESVRV